MADDDDALLSFSPKIELYLNQLQRDMDWNSLRFGFH
jgi:hypothetical protein